MGREVKCKVNVIAHPDTTADDGIRWELQSQKKSGEHRLRFDNEIKGDEHLITFEIFDKTGKNLVFPDDPQKALWVAKVTDPANPECPDEEVYDPEFDAEETKGPAGRRTKLIVRNKNSTPQQMAFTLRLIPIGNDQDDPNNYVPYDPISENNNRGIDLISDTNVIKFVAMSVCLLAGAISIGVLAATIFAFRALSQ